MEVLFIGEEPRLVDQVEACAAAAGVDLSRVSTAEELRRGWRAADVVLVGEDRAALAAGAGLPERARVHLVGEDPQRLVAWSTPLQASVIVLPGHAGLLSAVLDDRDGSNSGGGRVLRLVGGSGGLGVSSLAVALALAAARSGRRAAVVELDPLGGGLDLLCGVESLPGWRWPDLVSARGHVGDLGGRLPRCGEVDLVSQGPPGAESAGPPPEEALAAVVGSLRRTHDLVVLDAGRGHEGVTASVSAQVWLMVGAEVRAVMASRAVARALSLEDAQVVVRRGRGRGLAPDEVADALGLEVVGAVRDDPRVAVAAEAGEPPGRVARSVLGRAATALVTRVLDQAPPGELVRSRVPQPRGGPGPRRVAARGVPAPGASGRRVAGVVG